MHARQIPKIQHVERFIEIFSGRNEMNNKVQVSFA